MTHRGVRNVAIVVKHFMLGGLERVVIGQVEALLAEGSSVELIILQNDRDNCLLVEIPVGAKLHVAPKYRRIADIVAGKTVLLELADGSLLPRLRPYMRGASRVIRFCHSDYSHCRSVRENLLDRFLSDRFEDSIVAVGNQARDFLVEVVGIPDTKITTLSNAISPWGSSGIDLKWEIKERDGYLVSVQSMYRHKDHRTLLLAVAIANEGRFGKDRVKLVLIGDGDQLTSLRKLSIELGIVDDLIWLEAVWNREIVGAVLKGAVAFVSASRHEDLPISVLEARLAQIPLILSDISAHTEAASSAVLTTFPVGDAEVLAEALRSVWQQKAFERSIAFESNDSFVAEWADYSRRLREIVGGAGGDE